MSLFLITYDLRTPGRDYDSLIDAIKAYGTWGKITESCWVVKTTKKAPEIRDNLKSKMDKNDRIFVGELSGTAAWYQTICESDWLKTKLQEQMNDRK